VKTVGCVTSGAPLGGGGDRIYCGGEEGREEDNRAKRGLR
jgi:hypothetical protein